MKILVNEVFYIKEGVALRVTDDTNLKTIMMGSADYKAAFPCGLYEGAKLMAKKDHLGNIISVSPEVWFPVMEAKPVKEKEADDSWMDIS